MSESASTKPPKKFMTAVLLSFFLGSLGIDRFYLGYPRLGILKFLSMGGFGIWTVLDFIFIVTRHLLSADGQPLA